MVELFQKTWPNDRTESGRNNSISGVGFGFFSTTTGLESAFKKHPNLTVPELIENLQKCNKKIVL